MSERGHALLVLDVDVGTGLDQKIDGLDVALAVVAKEDRDEHGGPAHAIDVIEWRLGIDQRPHDLDMAEMRGRDQGRAVERAGNPAWIGAVVERQLEELYVVIDGRQR